MIHSFHGVSHRTIFASGVVGSAVFPGSLQKHASSHCQRPLWVCRMMYSHVVPLMCPGTLWGRIRIGGGEGGALSGRGGALS